PPVAGEGRRVGTGGEDRERYVGTALLGQPLAHPADLVRRGVRPGQPRVTGGGQPPPRGRALPAEVDRGVRLLHRLRPGEDRIEVDLPAVELRLVVGPDLLERGELLVDTGSAGGRVGAVVAHLLPVPA